MAPVARTNAFMYVDGYDATGDSNDLMLAASATDLDKTNFRSLGWEECFRGAKKVDFHFAGWWSASSTPQIDDESFNQLGLVDKVFTVGDVETEGQPAYMFKAAKHSYQAFGKYNETAPFVLDSTGSEGVAGLVRGALIKAKGSVSATGALGTAQQLGAVSATQYVYATLHIFPTAGTTITVLVESDDNSGFTTPTTRATLGPLTATGGTWATRVAGAITDDYWRFKVSAITGTFSVAGAIGIQ